jgi:hypothetical protein
MDAPELKVELKSWERAFQLKFGRKPTIEDIKQDPIGMKLFIYSA